MNREKLLKEAEKHFFEATRHGWVAGAKGTPVCDTLSMPGFKETIYEKSGFHVRDRYIVSSLGGKSFGTTTVSYLLNVVWVMSYGGYYPKDVIPFLKQALMAAYEKSEFLGGRGPLHFEKEGTDICAELIYKNNPEKNFFPDFKGYEVIISQKTFVPLGSHWYHGMSLI